jgi:hypothetical protein
MPDGFARLASLAALTSAMMGMEPAPPRPKQQPTQQRIKRRVRVVPAANTSFRSLRRACNSGMVMPQPSIPEMLRHRWFKKKVSAAVLHGMNGQPLPGDIEFLKAVQKAGGLPRAEVRP